MMLIKNSRVTIIRFFPFILSFREFIFLLIPALIMASESVENAEKKITILINDGKDNFSEEEFNTNKE